MGSKYLSFMWTKKSSALIWCVQCFSLGSRINHPLRFPQKFVDSIPFSNHNKESYFSVSIRQLRDLVLLFHDGRNRQPFFFRIFNLGINACSWATIIIFRSVTSMKRFLSDSSKFWLKEEKSQGRGYICSQFDLNREFTDLNCKKCYIVFLYTRFTAAGELSL